MTQVSGVVQNISNTSFPDGTVNANFLQGKSGELLDAKLHGDFYTQNYRGRLFFATTATAGTTIPIQASALASTFTLLNPVSSGINVELVSWTMALEAATTVVSDISLYFQTQVGTANAALASLTALTTRSGFLGGSFSSQANVYSAATFTGALVKGPTLAGPGAVTTTNILTVEWLANGRIIVPPGVAITTAGNAAQASAASQTYFWIETPL